MFHWFGVVQNTRGDSLPGWQVGLVDLNGMNVMIFADENSTPIQTVSGIPNRAVADDFGNYDFFVPSGTYTLQFFNREGEFQRAQRFVAMYGMDSATAAEAAAGDAGASATLSQAWAEGTLPGGAGTKSAREWAGDAGGFADDAAQSAAYAGGFETPEYASQAAGDAATTPGQIFRVAKGTTPQTFDWYRRLSSGSELVDPLATSAVVQSKFLRFVDVLDYIPVAEHDAIKAGTSTYDCSADFAAAHAAAATVYVPEGRYHLGSTVIVGAGGIGQRGFLLAGGAHVTRLASQSSDTTPLFRLRADDCFVSGVAGTCPRVTSENRCPNGIITIGALTLATALETNMHRMAVENLWVRGPVFYGQTSGAPDVAIKLCNPQLTPDQFASYFNRVKNVHLGCVNYGIQLQGFANGNFISDFDGWFIGNSTLADDRALVFFDGAQQNQVTDFFFHFSPGSSCIKIRDRDNTGVTGGFNHVPVFNYVRGQTEQDPTAADGIGLDAPDTGATGSFNRIILLDNCPTNVVGATFGKNNNITLNESAYYGENRHYFAGQIDALSFVATGVSDRPSGVLSSSVYVDPTTQEGRWRSIIEGVDWRDAVIEARDFFVSNAGSRTFRATANGFGYVASVGGTVTQATSKATAVTLNKVTGLITTHGEALAAGAAVSFTLTCDKAALGDLVVVQHVSGGTAAAYLVTALSDSGSVTITLRNVTAGSLSEAISLRFAVIKSGDG